MSVKTTEDPPQAVPETGKPPDSGATSERHHKTNTTKATLTNDKRIGPAEILADIAEGCRLFHSPDGSCYADIEQDGRRKTIPIKGLKEWLHHAYYLKTGKSPPSDAIRSANETLAARAKYDGGDRPVYVRVANESGAVFLDLADDAGRVVEITANGWRLIKEAPVSFLRPPGLLHLPEPEPGGSIDELRPFLNIKDDSDFVLVITYLIAALHPPGPYPLIAVSGVQGSAKSSFSRFIRAIVDPNSSPLREIPRSPRELFIMAKATHVIALDNLPRISDWASDALCRLSTGGGFSTRKLHTDDDVVLFDVTRPIILNGIEETVGRPDLADRTIFISLDALSSPRPEEELRQEFNHAQPRVLGAILDGLAHCLRELPTVHPENYSRMADFVKIGTACEGAFWSAGTFREAYASNRARAVDAMIEADPVAAALVEMMSKRSEWSGTATRLSAILKTNGGFEGLLPNSPNALSGRLNRIQPALRQREIEISHIRAGRQGNRLISIHRSKQAPSAPSAPSASHAVGTS